MYVVCAFGTTIGFHRYFTHKGFEARAAVKAALAILGCMTMQGPLTQWVTDHRKHHALSDKDGDPHSPHVGHGDGAWGAARGFVHAHVGWLFRSAGRADREHYAKDLINDKGLRVIARLFMPIMLVSLLVPALVGWLVIGGWYGALAGLVWGGGIRIFLLHHVTWSIKVRSPNDLLRSESWITPPERRVPSTRQRAPAEPGMAW